MRPAALSSRASAALGAGLVVDLAWSQGAGSKTVYAPNAFIRIDGTGAVTLVMPMVEMGQGSYTSMAMLLAEELEVGLDQVRVEHAPPNDALYANKLLHIQSTGLSSTIRAFWTPLRQAGAVGRTLRPGAAKQWGVAPDSCRAERGAVLHPASGRKARYGELAEAAAALPAPAPESVALKEAKDFKLIGTAARRIDTPDKVNGRTQFGIDVKLPAMKVAAIAISTCVRWQAEIVELRRRPIRQGSSSGRAHRRSGCRGRRSHVGSEERPQGRGHSVGRRPKRERR